MPSGFDKYSPEPCNGCHAYRAYSDGATIQKIGGSALARDKVGHAEDSSVLAPRLGDVAADGVKVGLVEVGTVDVERAHYRPTAVSSRDALLANGPRCRLAEPAGVETLDDNLRHGRAPSHPYVARRCPFSE